MGTEDLVKTWDIHCVARGCGHMRNLDCKDAVAHQFKVPKERGLYVEVDSKWKDLCHDTIVERIMTSRRSYLKRNADRSKREDAYYAQKSKDDKVQNAVEAMRRASFKFPGRMKIHVSAKFGFTKFIKPDYQKWKSLGRLIPDGTSVRW